MNEKNLLRLVDLVYQHYQTKGSYELIPSEIGITGMDGIKTIDFPEFSGGETLIYHTSLTLDSSVLSSKTGMMIATRPCNIKKGLYWITESQGFENARIIAHIGSYDGDEQNFYAQVAE